MLKMKKKFGSILSGAVVAGFFLFFIGLILYMNSIEHIPILFLLYCLGPLSIMLIGILIALKQRIKEIDGGEEDEARKY